MTAKTLQDTAKLLGVLATTAVFGGMVITTSRSVADMPHRLNALDQRVSVIEAQTAELRRANNEVRAWLAAWKCVIEADMDGKSPRPCIENLPPMK